MRNAQNDFDLSAIVRNQSNELLALSQTLEAHAQRGFTNQRRFDRDLESALAQLDELHLNLPSLLADQDLAIETVRELVQEGALDKSALHQKKKDIANYRKALLGSLDASASRAKMVERALEKTKLSARTDQAKRLSGDLQDARTSIALQL